MTGSPWRPSWRFDPVAARMADEHYNRQKPGTSQFVPPGRCLVLKIPGPAGSRAVWVTSWPDYPLHDWGRVWYNSTFRREPGCPYLASDLISWAVAHTRWHWRDRPAPGRIITFVNPRAVRSANPGYCYLCAGWERLGITRKRKRLVLGQAEIRMPAPVPVPGAPIPLFEAADLAAIGGLPQ